MRWARWNPLILSWTNSAEQKPLCCLLLTWTLLDLLTDNWMAIEGNYVYAVKLAVLRIFLRKL